MVYTVEDSWLNSSGRRVYKCKDSFGRYSEVLSKDIKDRIKLGDVFPGFRISKDGRLIEDTRKQSAVAQAKPVPITVNMSGYQIFTGDSLRSRVDSWVNGKNRRYAVQHILNRLTNYEVGKVCVIKGIRRTGKTTAIMHTIDALLKKGVPPDRIGYITVTENADTNEVITKIGDNYWEYVFVDEITLLTDVLSKLKTVSDVIAGQKKVVLTGTDSYVWPIAATDVLYGRQSPVDLTYMSFKEYCDVFPNRIGGLSKRDAVEHFCRYGGVLSKEEYADMQKAYESVQTSLVGNIVNTILKNKNHPTVKNHVGELYRATREQLSEAVVSAILVASKTQGGKHSRLEGVKIPELAASILEKQGIFKSSGMSSKVLERLIVALVELNVLDRVDNIAKSFEEGVEPEGKTVFTCHVSSLYNAVVGAIDYSSPLTGEAFENLILSQCVQFAKTEAFNYISAGKSEDVVVRHCRYRLTSELLKKYGEKNETPEIDVIVQRRNSGGVCSTCVIEAKLDDTTKGHAKNFFIGTMKQMLGKVDKYIVVYTGETKPERDVWYVNAYDFLMDIGKWVMV